MTDDELDELYAEIDLLRIDMEQFSPEVGFPFLQRKMADVISKSELATELRVKLAKMMDRTTDEEAGQKALYSVTNGESHKQAAKVAAETMKRLKQVAVVLKLRTDRLRQLAVDIRMYVRIVEDALNAELGKPAGQGKRSAAVPSVLSSMAQGDRASEQTEDLSGLFAR